MPISKPPQKKAVQDAAFDKFIDQIDERPGRRDTDLAIAPEPRFDLRTTGTVRLSRPAVFRTQGEILVRDDQRGGLKDPGFDQELMRRCGECSR